MKIAIDGKIRIAVGRSREGLRDKYMVSSTKKSFTSDVFSAKFIEMEKIQSARKLVDAFNENNDGWFYFIANVTMDILNFDTFGNKIDESGIII